MSPQTIVITGSSGYFARILLPLLEADSDIDRIVGIDRQPLPESLFFLKFKYHQLDIQDTDLTELIHNADVLIHLGFVLMRRHEDKEIDNINIRGSQAIFQAAGSSKLRKLITTTSAAGYGLLPDNPMPLTDEFPLRPNPGLHYGKAKPEAGKLLDAFEVRHPDIIVTRLRACTVIGPQARQSQIAHRLAKTIPVAKGYSPPALILYEEDLAESLYLAVKQDLPGAYDVTSYDHRTLRQLVESLGGRAIALPGLIIKALMALLWLTGISAFAPEWVDLNRFSIIAGNNKLKATGRISKYSTIKTYEALQAVYS
jgi:nucleoside-diphosphate-sugar epimerase